MKLISDQVFAFDRISSPVVTHERCSAEDLGLKESWFRDAIYDSPELVIGPCRAAGLTSDEWYSWRKEFPTEVGPIDVLLVSSQGRVALVETKLASNPELRRKVLAQVLDYLAHLPATLGDSMPDVPVDADGTPVADAEDIREAVSEGDVLLIIASDEVDSRVAKLALIDIALYRPLSPASGHHMIIPTLRNLVESEPRQVVRVIVQGENPRARVEVERVAPDETTTGRRKWDEKRFFESLASGAAPSSVRALAGHLRDLASQFPDSVALDWGTGRDGSMVVKRNEAGLIEVFGAGNLRFRPWKFDRALGEASGRDYYEALRRLLPRAMAMKYPFVAADEAAKVAPAVFELVHSALRSAT
jgi:hypothetical protein